MPAELKKTDRTTISRHDERGSYDRATAYEILDEGLVAHVGLDTGNGVMVIPMTYARLGDELFLHGAVASRWLSSFEGGRPVSVCVTILDGLVLAKSAFSHSMNYRSVVAFGEATVVNDLQKKRAAFKALLDHLVPGRWEDSRQPDDKETQATVVLSVPIDEASVKIRSGPPKDAAKDLDLPYWAGVIPLQLSSDVAIPDPAMNKAREVPAYAVDYTRSPSAKR
ncbi:MAG: pyridoxamine 5'-phosphate oxidase family protein [Woeseiaceae bacterium]|nr:pyridoxamine 5'-phosphate oxidase family protein [Woeseiaceae bacterium]